MGALAVGGDAQTQRALATRLDLCVGGLSQQRHGTIKELRVSADQPVQPVVLGGDFLALIEHQGEVPFQIWRIRQRGKCVNVAGCAGLHIHATQAEQRLLAGLFVHSDARRQVVSRRHGIDVPGEDHTVAEVALRAGDNRVSLPNHLNLWDLPQGGLEDIGNDLLIVGFTVDIHERCGERDWVIRQCQRSGATELMIIGWLLISSHRVSSYR